MSSDARRHPAVPTEGRHSWPLSVAYPPGTGTVYHGALAPPPSAAEVVLAPIRVVVLAWECEGWAGGKGVW